MARDANFSSPGRERYRVIWGERRDDSLRGKLKKKKNAKTAVHHMMMLPIRTIKNGRSHNFTVKNKKKIILRF